MTKETFTKDFKKINERLFTEEYTDRGETFVSNIGIYLAEGIVRDVNNLQNTETSNCLIIQYGRIDQVEAAALALIEQCKIARETLDEVEN